MKHAPRIYLDGAQVGEGEEELGFDLWLDISPGSHLLELRAGKRCWRCQFTLPPGDHVLDVCELTRTGVMLRTLSGLENATGSSPEAERGRGAGPITRKS
jgi:hypothetical protein